MIKHSDKIFRSRSFLNCSLQSLHHIFHIDDTNWNELKKFKGCIAWGKAECLRKQSNESDLQNVRLQLGDFFEEILFGEMSLPDFVQLSSNYDGVFSKDECFDITKIISKMEQSTIMVNRYLRRKVYFHL